MLPISVIFLTYNDEQLIEDGLKSVFGWVGEIIVVDSHSTDGTLAIAQKYADKIEVHPFENYAAQRNWAQTQLPLAHDWVFHIDADEVVSPELRQSIHEFFAQLPPDNIDGCLMARRTMFMGRWIRHGGHYPVFHLRLFRRERGACEERLYDQHYVVPGGVEKLDGDLIDRISTDLETWTLRHVRWAKLELAQQGDRLPQPDQHVSENLFGSPIEQRRWAKTNLFYRLPLFLRVFAYFCYRYFLRLGFLDGVEGLIFHFLQGFWFRFYIDALIWEQRQRAKSALPYDQIPQPPPGA
ncbi:MAG: glycosyltransferase family 2 protein [Anaerolineae bacterium]|nr:glycosyltransferase family 2 protein [Anaerolineae bacterium]